MKHLTIKSWHHSSLCLPTDYHAACHSGCKCKSKISNKCGLFHLRPQRYSEIKAENKTFKMFSSEFAKKGGDDSYDDTGLGVLRGENKSTENELSIVWLIDDEDR